ncbi:hypothetical protein Bbelb_230330 [Branchiostoma belcheri]|nr:hypothetical protein Bbelb_230330 [Branchiostoma belcheri]
MRICLYVLHDHDVVVSRAIGVAGVDATLEEIENILVNDQWGSVYTFLINNEGETIFHPLLRPSTQLVDDPIFIPIRQLEMPNGKPEKFLEVEEAMKRGKRGSLYIKDAIRGIPKGDFQDGVKVIVGPATYYYTALNDSVYAFAFNLADTDKNFRHPKEPKKTPKIPTSYYNLLTAYNVTRGQFNTSVREQLGSSWGAVREQFQEDVITHCYPLERISATALVLLAMDSAPRDCTGPEPVSNIKPRRTTPLPHDRDPHGFTEKPIQFNRRKNLPGLRKRAINLKEYRADFAFEESIQNMKLCANSGSHQALASTRFLHKTCSQGK